MVVVMAMHIVLVLFCSHLRLQGKCAQRCSSSDGALSRAPQRRCQHQGVFLVAINKPPRWHSPPKFIVALVHAVGTAQETLDVARNVRRDALVWELARVHVALAAVDRGVMGSSVHTRQVVLGHAPQVVLIQVVRTVLTAERHVLLAALALVALVDVMCVQVVR